jgi:hypothetical protein
VNTHPSSVEIDQLMAAVDRDWGFARLPQLVPNDLAQKFARQVQKYQQAVEDDDEAAIELHAGGLRRGVAALEAAARAAGHMPRHEQPPEPERPAHWIVPLSGQAYIRVVKTHDEARLLGADGGEPVLTAVEVGVLIEASQGWSTIREAKRHWPTAALRLGAKADPNWDVGDDISHLTQEAAQ